MKLSFEWNFMKTQLCVLEKLMQFVFNKENNAKTEKSKFES